MKTQHNMCKDNKTGKKIYWGSILIIAGTLLLARNLNLLPFAIPAYVFTWKMLLLVVGIFLLLIKKKVVGGVIVTTLACAFLAPDILGIPSLDFHRLWPAFLILVGLALLFKTNSSFKKKEWRMPESSTPNENTMEATAIFGGENKKISSYDFKGGKITAVFGGLELDLTNCYLSSEKAEIEVLAICGGISLKVPKEWNVRSEIVPIMGGIEDKIYHMPGTYVDPAAELLLRGNIVMGGLEIIRE